MALPEIDYMEYANDAAAQAAYVTNGGEGESVDQECATYDNGFQLGDAGGNEYRIGQSFQLSGALTISAIEIRRGTPTGGTPSGNWTIRIETDDGGSPNLPTGTLANANASVVVAPPEESTIVKGTFATPFALSAATTYWIVVECDDQATGSYWVLSIENNDGYASGEMVVKTAGTWAEYASGGRDMYFKVYVQTAATLQSYSESTIKTQGSYALKGVATTGALNKTLTRTIT